MIPEGRQAGAALLSILLIVATLSVAALMATEAIARQTELQKLSARRTEAIWAARSAESAALAAAADLVSASRLPAGSGDTGREHSLFLPTDAGQIILTLREMAPCFNLNALAGPDEAHRLQQAGAFQVLLQDIGVPPGDASALGATLGDWIDEDQVAQPGGGEDSDYLADPAGLRTAGQLLLSPAELAALPGFTPELREAIAEMTCVLPEAGAPDLNVNALTPETAPLLRSAVRGALSAAEARRFIESRPAAGWNSVQEVREFAEGRAGYAQAFAGVPLAVRGEYFTGSGSAELDAGSWSFSFILYAGPEGPPKVVWRSFGGGR